jgi:hypothetical protein
MLEAFVSRYQDVESQPFLRASNSLRWPSGPIHVQPQSQRYRRSEYLSGMGMLWSNRIRMCRFSEAVSHESDNLFDLLSCNTSIPTDDVLDGRSPRKAFKNDGDGQPGVAEHPCAVDPLWIRLH